MEGVAPVQRWTPARKAEVVKAIQRGRMTFNEALERHDLTPEELTGWIAREAAHGHRGLSVTRLQQVRS